MGSVGVSGLRATPDQLFQRLADEALIGNASFGGLSFERIHQQLRQTHVDEGGFAFSLPCHGFELVKSREEMSWARKASASALASRIGTVFIASDLYVVHVTGADG